MDRYWWSGYGTPKKEVVRTNKKGSQGFYTHWEATRNRVGQDKTTWCLELIESDSKRHRVPRGESVLSMNFATLQEAVSYVKQVEGVA